MSSSADHSTAVDGSFEKEVLTTVFNFDQFKIKKFTHHTITIVEATGNYSPLLVKEIEKIASHVRGSLGLDLGGVNGLQPTLLNSLKNIQRRLSSRKHQFILSNPSERLLDLLKLNDLTNHFQVVFGDSITKTLKSTKSEGTKTASPSRALRKPKPKAPTQANPVRRKIAHLTHSLKRTEILEKGLDSASRCVRRFLPSRPPEVDGYDFAFSYTPCDKVGGDFFDFVPIDDDNLGISIGDVSGHGLDSAIIMGMAKKVIRLRAKELAHEPPAEVLRRSNMDLFEDLGRRLFVTALYARLDLARGIVYFARAGHEPPICFRPGGNRKPSPTNSEGIALGMDPGPRFSAVIEEKSLALERGDCLVLYTDGIVECWNSRHDLFSRDRLLFTLEKMPSTADAEEILARVNAAVDQFSEGNPPEDDMTAIVIMRR